MLMALQSRRAQVTRPVSQRVVRPETRVESRPDSRAQDNPISILPTGQLWTPRTWETGRGAVGWTAGR